MNALQSIPAFKVVLLGDSGVGKTSIVQFLQRQVCDPAVDATIGASFVSRDMSVEGGTITLHIWDTAGQERYRSLVPTYSRGACAGLIVFDLASVATFDHLDFWIKVFRDANANAGFVYIIGNKSDLPPGLPNQKAENWAAALSLRFFSVSAKLGLGVHEMFQAIAEEIAVKKPPALRQFGSPDPEVPAKAEGRCC
jgi:small GTP-binding protein